MKAILALILITLVAACGGNDTEITCKSAAEAHYAGGCFETYGDGSYLPQKTFEEYCLTLEYNSYERAGHCLPEMDRWQACINKGSPCDCSQLESHLKSCFVK